MIADATRYIVRAPRRVLGDPSRSHGSSRRVVLGLNARVRAFSGERAGLHEVVLLSAGVPIARRGRKIASTPDAFSCCLAPALPCVQAQGTGSETKGLLHPRTRRAEPTAPHTRPGILRTDIAPGSRSSPYPIVDDPEVNAFGGFMFRTDVGNDRRTNRLSPVQRTTPAKLGLEVTE